MAHDHGSVTARHRGSLVAVLALTTIFMAVEAVAGLITGSLVLIADAGHMLADVAALSIAVAAIWLARRPPTARKTYGYYRAEILGALVNSALLVLVALYILYEAVERFRDPPDVASVPLLIVASVGLVVNIIGAGLLMRGARENLNMRGAFVEVVGDLLGSLGAIAAGIVLLTTGWRYADPLIAGGVGAFILPRTWSLMRSAIDVLFEGTPAHIDLPDVQAEMMSKAGVQSVHDLHVWAVTSGFVALSGHVQVGSDVDRDALLVTLRRSLTERFHIEHVTIQVEDDRLSGELEQPCFPEAAAWDSPAIPARVMEL